MSLINVNTIEPSTGTDITLGASGDTITVPSGATFTQSGTMNASAITAGTMATARLGSGTASSTTILYGDQTYKTEPSSGLSQYFFAWDADTGGTSGDIVLDTTTVNSGSNYATGTGLYTAPSAGDYFFQVNFRRAGTGSATIYFEKNGTQEASSNMEYSGTSNTTATFSLILTLATSDTIGWVSGNNINPSNCKFFGWKMS
jgi:hypothetical protein